MHSVTAQNPDQALQLGIALLNQFGEYESSRGGTVLVMPTPVATVFTTPQHRVSFSVERDANPFFHLYEALWMLGGRNDLESMTRYVARFKEFSDDGTTLHGAYGYRWRTWFGYDQLSSIVDELAANPNSRRAVLAMWDGQHDLERAMSGGKDVPCNTQVYFRIRQDKLDMTVTCRSNDMVWGAYGANVVHFSMLQEYVAQAVGVGIGIYYQMSNNFHAYIERPDVAKIFEAAKFATPTHYRGLPLNILERATLVHEFDAELAGFLDGEFTAMRPPRSLFLRELALPMRTAHAFYKHGDFVKSKLALAGPTYRYDWAQAGLAWLARREDRRFAAAKSEVR